MTDSFPVGRSICAALAIIVFAGWVLTGASGALLGQPQSVAPAAGDGAAKAVAAAKEQTTYTLHYDSAYRRIAYPGGDVPRERGVCTDVLVRAFRAAGVDLQSEVHEDMRANFAAYPKRWRLPRPDTNIDHRRVPNLMTYFKRKGKALALPRDAAAIQSGDVVAWDLGGGVLHIGIATDARSADGKRPMFVHNIGRGAQLEDILFSWRVIGHYRYF